MIALRLQRTAQKQNLGSCQLQNPKEAASRFLSAVKHVLFLPYLDCVCRLLVDMRETFIESAMPFVADLQLMMISRRSNLTTGSRPCVFIGEKLQTK